MTIDLLSECLALRKEVEAKAQRITDLEREKARLAEMREASAGSADEAWKLIHELRAGIQSLVHERDAARCRLEALLISARKFHALANTSPVGIDVYTSASRELAEQLQ